MILLWQNDLPELAKEKRPAHIKPKKGLRQNDRCLPKKLQNAADRLLISSMNKLLPSDKIYVAQSKISGAGRGVFASVFIKQGEVIEVCPVIHIPEHEIESVENSVLVTYIYFLGKNKDQLALALGFGSIYNHADKPNVLYTYNSKAMTLNFIATKYIGKDEEITVDYNQGGKHKHPLWFIV